MPSERVLLVHPTPAWLPAGGRAEVVLAGSDSVPPNPTCLVRLLATRDGHILSRRRTDGRGLDIPTVAVRGAAAGATPEVAARRLVTQVVGTTATATLLGYVRNVVPEAPDDYPWPSPVAHFAVWHCAMPADCDPSGVWLDRSRTGTELTARHWWPLAAHVEGLPVQR